MDAKAPGDLMACFDVLEDPRMERTRKHHLGDILALTLLAVICGAEGFTDVEDFGKDQWQTPASQL